MLQAIAHAGLLPLKDVVADGLYGQSPDLLDAVDACVGVTTFVAIPSETRGGRQRPRTEDKTYPYTGDVRAKRVVVTPTHAPSSVAALAAHLPASRWSQRTVSEGTTGPIGYACPPPRTLCTEGLPDRTVWLVSKRTVGANPCPHTLSVMRQRARPGAPLSGSGVRWAIEPCCEEGKTERLSGNPIATSCLYQAALLR